MPVYNSIVGARIVVEAAKYVGLTEVRSNSRWDNLDTVGKDVIAEAFRGEMLRVGWQDGWPYCAAFCEVVWRAAYVGTGQKAELQDTVKKMLTPGCLLSFNNAAELGWTSKEPRVGAIGIMRKGETSSGHAFIVSAWNKDKELFTIEANTSPNPGTTAADRDGDGVYRKRRPLHFRPSTGLHLIGFIHPCV